MSGFISLTSTIQWLMTGSKSLTACPGTFRLVSTDRVHKSPHNARNSRINAVLSNGSPPPNVTPPLVARKYNSSGLVCLYSCSAVRLFHESCGSKHCGLMQYLHRSGQPPKQASVTTPSPSRLILWRATAMKGAVCIFQNHEIYTLYI